MGSEVDEPLSAEILDPDADGEWDEVRESWVESDLTVLEPAGRMARNPPPPRGARASVPPPLPPPHVMAAMIERLAAGDYEGTLIAARAALAIHPTNDDALQCRDIAASSLRALYAARLGLADGAPRIPIPTRRGATVDRRMRTVLELVDGRRSVEQIVQASPLDSLDTLELLSRLFLSDLVAFEG